MSRGAAKDRQDFKPAQTTIEQWHAAAPVAEFYFAKSRSDRGLTGRTPYGAPDVVACFYEFKLSKLK